MPQDKLFFPIMYQKYKYYWMIICKPSKIVQGITEARDLDKLVMDEMLWPTTEEKIRKGNRMQKKGEESGSYMHNTNRFWGWKILR